MLTFTPVVDKNKYARSREILTFRFSGAARSTGSLLFEDTLVFSTAVEMFVENFGVQRLNLSYPGDELWISGTTSSRPFKSS